MSHGDDLRGTLGRLTVDFWSSVRPRTRRGALLAATAILGASVVLAVVFLAGAMMAWSPYVESVARPESNPRAWAALELSYGDAAMCRRCHEQVFDKATSASHSGIGCESCHGASIEHALSDPAGDEPTALAVPTDELCVRCHVSAVGRPASVRQIVPDDHYVDACLQCHDPHTAISRRPLVVLHPLDNLPPCVTCHGPEGFKARNQRHPEVEGDEPCLACHAAGRGPEDE